MNKLGHDRWKKFKEYGKKLIAEITFSALKRVLGDSVSSRGFIAQKAEASLKVMLYS